MTREQLDAIRARLDAVPNIPWNASLLRLLNDDARDLLAEVDRLRATIDAVGEVISQNGEDCDCDCTAYGSPHGPDCEPCLACRVSDALGEKP